MSRKDFGSAYQSTYGSIGNTEGFSPRNQNDSNYLRLSDSIRNDVGLVSRKIENIKQMVNAQRFEILQNEQEESNRIAKETAGSLTTFSQMRTTNPTEARQREIAQETLEALQELETNLFSIEEMNEDMKVLVQEQGEMIDRIEADVDSTAVNVETANVQLEKARHYQKASRKRMCCLLVILLLAALVLGLIIYFAVQKN